MKLLLVFSVVVTYALAVPAPVENGGKILSEENPEILKQKSAPEQLAGNPTDEVTIESDGHLTDARSFHKLHKKKLPHHPPVHHHIHHQPHYPMHHYRDNEESILKEAELSNDKTIAGNALFDGSAEEHHRNLEKNIHIAKEAVETIEENFGKIEKKSSRLSDWKNSESDKTFHNGLQTAKNALNLVQKSFSDFENFHNEDAITSATNDNPVQMIANEPQNGFGENFKAKIAGELKTIETPSSISEDMKRENKFSTDFQSTITDQSAQLKSAHESSLFSNTEKFESDNLKDMKLDDMLSSDLQLKSVDQPNLLLNNENLKSELKDNQLNEVLKKETNVEDKETKLSKDENITHKVDEHGKKTLIKSADETAMESKHLTIPNENTESKPKFPATKDIQKSINNDSSDLDSHNEKTAEKPNSTFTSTKTVEPAPNNLLIENAGIKREEKISTSSEPKMAAQQLPESDSVFQETKVEPLAIEPKMSSPGEPVSKTDKQAVQPINVITEARAIPKEPLNKPEHRWKMFQPHAQARGSYGGSLYGDVNPGSGSAVGVFPNGHKNCAIPLLVSCSPSLVSGSLSKYPNSGYTAPAAYRASQHFLKDLP